MIDVFIAYSHNDLGLKNELKKFLRPLTREGRVSVWDDFDIEAGDDWDAAIKQRLYAADLVLLLVSADSLASDYFYGKEVQVSLERHQRGEAVVVPVILRHCDWDSTPLGSLEALPEKGRPVTEWPTRDQAFSDVVRRLRAVVGTLEQKRKAENDEAEERRQFEAAVAAAGQLFHKLDWAEAAQAYTSALALHRAGWAPERSALEWWLTECQNHLQTAEQTERIQREQTEQQQRTAAEQARRHEEEHAWRAAAADNTAVAYDTFAALHPKSPYATEARRRARALLAATKSAGNEGISRRAVLIVLAIVVLFVAGVWLWPGKKNGQEELVANNTSNAATAAPDGFVLVKGGTFQMGSEDGYDIEKPVHWVTVSDFYLAKNEVTQKQWREIMGSELWFKGCDDCPVDNVSWDDTQEFLKKINQKYSRQNYRLPTEAEWEYAARGGNQSKGYYYAGSNDVSEVAWYNDIAGNKTHPVGGKKSNELGIFDLSGNVWEWCQDTWHDSYTGAPTKGSAWTTGGDSSIRVLRGGSCDLNFTFCRSSYRRRGNTSDRLSNYGFRLARDP